MAPQVFITNSLDTQLGLSLQQGPMSPKQMGPEGTTCTEGVLSGKSGTGLPSIFVTVMCPMDRSLKVTLQ
jgi:hypothetical protein